MIRHRLHFRRAALEPLEDRRLLTVGPNGHEYVLVSTELTWQQAKLAAEQLPAPAGFRAGHLATIGDSVEQQFLYDNLTGPNKNLRAWIGFTDEAQEGEWRWIDGTPGLWQDPDSVPDAVQSAYAEWSLGEPNNTGNADFAVFNWNQGRWNDNSAAAPTYFLVEFEPLNSPVDIVFAPAAMPENSATGASVGLLATIDPDQAEGHSYTLVDDANGRFSIHGSEIKVANGSLLDYETNTQHFLRVRSTDSIGQSVERGFYVTVANVHETVDFRLSSSSVREDSVPETVVGTLLATDPEEELTGLALLFDSTTGLVRVKNFGPDEIKLDSYRNTSAQGQLDWFDWRSIFEWVADPAGLSESMGVLGPGDPSMASGWAVSMAYPNSLEESNHVSYALLSPGEAWFLGKPIENFDPTDISFLYRNPDSPSQDLTPGRVSFDKPDPVRYELIDSANGRFELVGDRLLLSETVSLDFESNKSHIIRVRATDLLGTIAEQDLRISVINVNEPPLVTVPGDVQILPVPSFRLVGVSVIDPDIGNTNAVLRVTLTTEPGILHAESLYDLNLLSGANDSQSMVLEGPQHGIDLVLSQLTCVVGYQFGGLITVSVTVDDRGNLGEGGPNVVTKATHIRMNTPPVPLDDVYSVVAGSELKMHSYEISVRESRPTAYWRLGDNRGTAEELIAGLDGTMSLETGLGVRGAMYGDRDTAAAFEGLNARILVPEAGVVTEAAAPFSLEAWISPNYSGPNQRILSTRNGPSFGWALGLDHQRLVFTSFGIQDYLLEGPLVPIYQWTHVAVVLDEHHDASFYLNGVFAGKVDGFSTPNRNENGRTLAIGDNPDEFSQPWQGKLDEVAFFARELSAAEITRHFQAGQGNVTTNPNVAGVQPSERNRSVLAGWLVHVSSKPRIPRQRLFHVHHDRRIRRLSRCQRVYRRVCQAGRRRPRR
jgi:hypothetical protein